MHSTSTSAGLVVGINEQKQKSRVVIWKCVSELKTLVAWNDCCVSMHCMHPHKWHRRQEKDTWNNSFVESACTTTTTKGNEWWMNSEECHTYINCFLALVLIRRILFASTLSLLLKYTKSNKMHFKTHNVKENRLKDDDPSWKLIS